MNPLDTYIVWDVNPEIFSLGPLSIRWYGLLFATGFMLGYWIITWIYKIEGKPEKDLDPLLLSMVLGTVIGARLGHCLFYDPAYYLSNPVEILKIWKGGLASHGGAFGILLALYFFSKKRPTQPYLWLLGRVAVPTALAGSFIRLGNLMNSEILGKTTDLPWAFIFKRAPELSQSEALLPRHPAQLYESIIYLIIFIVLLFVYKKYKGQTPRGMLIGLFFVLVFTARFFIEFIKLDQEASSLGLPINMGQLLSLPLIATGIYFFITSKKRLSIDKNVSKNK